LAIDHLIMNKHIGIIGYGNMGRAIAERIKGDYPVTLFDKDTAKTSGVSGVTVCLNSEELVAQNDAIIVAVKPQDFDVMLSQIQPAMSADKVIISIAAGISTSRIEKKLGVCRVVRVMPNMAAQIGAGITGITGGRYATQEDIDLAEDIFEYVGEVVFVDEGMMHAVTAVSGSGPAYVCYFLEKNNMSAGHVPQDKKDYFIESFISAAMNEGLDAATASELVHATYTGTIKYLQETALPAAELRKRVTSKGGTTEAALAVLEQGGILSDAVHAAVKRSEELSK